jgi:hypothetical protein
MEGGMMAGNETLYLKDKNQSYMINKTSKSYSLISHKDNSAGKMEADLKYTKTTETQKILNYTCTKTIVTVTDKGQSINQIYWTTNEIKDLDLKSLSGQSMNGKQSMFYEKLDGVPMKMEMITPQMKMVMQVTEIKKTPVANSSFEIPAGFTETKLPGQY